MKKTLMNTLVLVFLVALFSCKADKKPAIEPERPPIADSTPFKSLNFLYQISGSKTIGGIHNREPNAAPARWTDSIQALTGEYPGMWSGDFLFQQDNIDNRRIMVNEALKQWQQGAMVNIMWHACNPANGRPCNFDDGKGVLSHLSDDQWKELLTDGSELNKEWKTRIDEVCVYLKDLQGKGVEVFWRPLHEMNQGKFWWGGRPGPDGTAKLYRMMHDYMTKTKGLTNLIWVWDLQDFGSLASDVKTYDPGDDYWDVIALDVYDGGGYTSENYKILSDAAGEKPMGIGECQKLPSPAILAAQPKWTFFMGWSELTFSSNSDAEIKGLYLSPRVLSLDEMPGWK